MDITYEEIDEENGQEDPGPDGGIQLQLRLPHSQQFFLFTSEISSTMIKNLYVRTAGFRSVKPRKPQIQVIG